MTPLRKPHLDAVNERTPLDISPSRNPYSAIFFTGRAKSIFRLEIFSAEQYRIRFEDAIVGCECFQRSNCQDAAPTESLRHAVNS